MSRVAWLITFGLLFPLAGAAIPPPEASAPAPVHAADLLLALPAPPEAPLAPGQRLAAALAARDGAALAAVALEAAGASGDLVAAATGGPSLGLPAGDLTGDGRDDAFTSPGRSRPGRTVCKASRARTGRGCGRARGPGS